MLIKLTDFFAKINVSQTYNGLSQRNRKLRFAIKSNLIGMVFLQIVYELM